MASVRIVVGLGEDLHDFNEDTFRRLEPETEAAEAEQALARAVERAKAVIRTWQS